MTKKKIAILDFDGTLSARYISMDFMNYLHENNVALYNHGFFQEQQMLLEKLNNGKINYSEWIRDCLELWADGIQYNTKNKMAEMAEKFFAEFKKNIYPSSYKLVKLLKQKRYLFFYQKLI